MISLQIPPPLQIHGGEYDIVPDFVHKQQISLTTWCSLMIMMKQSNFVHKQKITLTKQCSLMILMKQSKHYLNVVEVAPSWT